jgi:hypothetical protein
MIASLLIATQGLMPSPTPLSIGVHGLLFVSVVPPVPITPTDLPGGGGRRDERKVTLYALGNRLRYSVGSVDISAGTRINVTGSAFNSCTSDAALSISASTTAKGNRNHTGTGRAGISISSTFNVVGCEEENELEVYLMAQAAMELMDSI